MTTDPVKKMRDDLIRVHKALQERFFYTLVPGEKEALLLRAEDLREKIDTMSHSSLVVGLLGGTGVGKSSLMNALAQSEIATTSHRRPLTDSVLVYRYRGTPIPADLQTSQVAWKEYIHEVDAIRQILLCDLPDFDSLIGEHRDNVINFLEYVDLLVFVTSPEKYADGRFYELLHSVTKDNQNFIFVLNKVDLLFHERSAEVGYEELGKVTDSLQRHLKANGIDKSPTFIVSALEYSQDNTLSHWNQFPVFARHVFQQRELKEIRNIKTMNLDRELKDLRSYFENELIALEMFQSKLAAVMADLNEERREMDRAVRATVAMWSVNDQLQKELITKVSVPSALVGPTNGFDFLSQGWSALKQEPAGHHEGGLDHFFEEMTATFHFQLDILKNRLTGELLRKGISAAFTEKLDDIVGGEAIRADVKNRLQGFFAEHVVAGRHTFSLFLFKGMQYATYIILFLLLVFSLAGDGSWQGIFKGPGWSTMFNFLINALYAVFSPRGLAALGSYALINIFLGYSFYIRYKRLMDKRVEMLIEYLENELVVFGEEELARAVGQLRQYGDELKTNIYALSELKARQK